MEQELAGRRRKRKAARKCLTRLAKYIDLTEKVGPERLRETLRKVQPELSSDSETEDGQEKFTKDTSCKRTRKTERDDSGTESDSDFEAEPLKRPRLDEYMTMGEVAGQIPESLLLNVSFEKFTKENGFEAIDQEF